MEDGFNITNEDVIINYIPSSNVINYSYTINDNSPVYVYDNSNTNLKLSESGTYNIVFNNVLDDNNIDYVTYKYVIDKKAPKFNVKDKTYIIKSGESFKMNVTAFDNYDGDLTNSISSNINDIDFKSSGIKKVEISVSDSAGNVSSDTLFVTVKKNNTSLLYLGWVIIIILFILLVDFFYKYIKSIKYEKRLTKFSIKFNSKSDSLFDSIYNSYQKFISKYSIYLNSFNLLKKSSKKYEKYNLDGMEFIMRKIVLGVIYVLAYVVLNTFMLKVTSIIEIFIPFLLGYVTLDIVYYFKYLKYRKQIKEDLLKSITLLNNAFKSGRSIEQAIETVSIEMEGPIAIEFKRIKEELDCGLDLDTVFKRFKDRIKLDEAAYLSASISVVNLTGGNIIKIFDSIEKTLYSKKKLNNELNALTSSSKFIMYVLIFVPILFVIFISLINKDYFTILFTHPLGYLLIGFELLIYIIYIIVVRKVMKIR